MTEGRPSSPVTDRQATAAEDRAVRAFSDRFGGAPTLIVHAPGRVNLLGEHTDYNEGFVLPMALHLGAWIALRPRADDRVVLRSLDFDDEQSFQLGALERGHGWIEYVKGTAWAFQQAGSRLRGWDGVLTGEIPIGAGLASSAALEVAAARAFAAAAGLPWQPVTAARLAQRAENGWVGVQCGIMDQLVVACGREGHALLIDCRDLTTRPIPLPRGTVVAVLDTSTRRDLVDSTYNERRARCEEATRRCGVRSLRDLTIADLERRAGALGEALLPLARHVVTENARTLAAADAMKKGDAATVGALMGESHRSLRDDFGVSGPALDAIVAAAQASPGCFGARMTGAGLAGCAVALVHEGASEGFAERVASAYRAATGLTAAVHLSHPSDGAAVTEHRQESFRTKIV
jgi:galactokinase